MRGVLITLGLMIASGGAVYAVMAGSSEEAGATAPSDAPAKAKRRGKGSSRSGGGGGRADGFQPRRDGSLEDRVARLEDEVAALRRQLAVRGRVALSGSGSIDPEELAASPELDAQVRDIVEDERVREEERRSERRAERFAEFRSEALDELVKVAGITEEQRESIDGLWMTEAERIIPLITEARAGDRSFREVRDEVEGFRKETDEAVAAMLSEAQYESYEELRPRGPGGRRGGRGGRGEPPPPPQ